MPIKKLEAKVVANAKAPKSGRLELWDSLLRGFGLSSCTVHPRTASSAG
jgi:hypothetical protein